MASEDSLKPRNTVDVLLDHQTQRLEDIANNAVDFIRINLLILGAFAPFLATILSEAIDPVSVLNSEYAGPAMATWLISIIVASSVYKIARTQSMSQFDTLEEAVVHGWRDSDLRDEMIDNNEGYERLTRWLMLGMAVGIAFSIMAILFLAFSAADAILQIPDRLRNANVLLVIVAGGLAGVGIELVSQMSKYLSLGKIRLKQRISPSPPYRVTEISPSADLEGGTGAREIDYLTKFDEVTPIRARLIRAIRESFGTRPWSISELTDRLEEEYPDIGVTRGMIQRLNDAGFVQELPQPGPSTYILHEREGEIINGRDLDKEVGEELGRVIGHLTSDEKVRKVVADALDVKDDTETVKSTLVQGNTFDRIDTLNRAIDWINEELPEAQDHWEGKEYGRIRFMKRSTKYRLSSKAVRPYVLSRIEQATQAFNEGNLVEASVLVSGALEIYLRSIYLEDKSGAGTEANKLGLAQLAEAVQSEGRISSEATQMLRRIQEIRNKAVHSPDMVMLDSDQVEQLLQLTEDLLTEQLE